MKEFISQTMGYVPEDTIQRQLRQLALEFHYECEMFDRSVCSFSNKGIAMPTGPGERNRCDENFRHVRDDFYRCYVYMLGVSPLQWRNAISDYTREFEEQFRAALRLNSSLQQSTKPNI